MLASIPSPSFNGVHLGPLEIRIYGLAYVVGVIAAIAITTRRWERQGGSRELVHEVALWGFPAGLIGGRLYFLATSWNEVPHHWWGPLAIWHGGLGIWGGIALGTLGGLWVLRRRGADIPGFLNAAAPGLLVAQAIGRIGNYFNQELFGGPTGLPWGLRIDSAHRPAGYEAYSTFHPTFLYELTWNLAGAGALIWLGRRRQIRAPGLFALYVAGYSGFRIFEELLRTDPAHHILGLRLNFFVAAVLCLTGLAWFARIQRTTGSRQRPSRGGPAALGLGWLIVALSGCGHGSHAQAKQLSVTVTKHPAEQAVATTARLDWRASRRAQHATCRLDSRRPRRCHARLVYRHLKPGRHRFRVTVRRGARKATAHVVWRIRDSRQSEASGRRKASVAAPSAPIPQPSPDEPLTSDVLWRAGMENGSLSDWYYPESGPTGSYGGGEYNSDGGDTVPASTLARSGSWSAKASLLNGSGGTRLFRWRELRANRDLVLESAYYIPDAYRLTADPNTGRFWNIFQFKSRSTTGSVDPIWYVDLQNRADGTLRPTVVWWHRTLQGPHPGETGFRRFQPSSDMTIPTGRWFSVKARLRQSKDFDGYLQIWIDGQLVFDQTGIRTSYQNCNSNSWCTSNEWSVNNYSDGLSASPATMYFDDAQISRAASLP